MFLAYVFEPPSGGHPYGTTYVLAAKVEGSTVTVSSFWMGLRRESIFRLSENTLSPINKNDDYYIVQDVIDRMKNKTSPYPFVTLSTKTTYEQLIEWHKEYANKKKEPDCPQLLLWLCSTTRNYGLGNNCTDEGLRVLRDGCGIFPKTTTFTKILQSICATTVCVSTCACVGLCVCAGLTAPTFPIEVNTPTQVFSALESWVNQTQEHNSVNFLDHIHGKTTTGLMTDRSKEEKVDKPREEIAEKLKETKAEGGPQPQVMLELSKKTSDKPPMVRFWRLPPSSSQTDQKVILDRPSTAFIMSG